MELENLKILWKDNFADSLIEQQFSREELMKMLRAKSSDAIEKIKRSIRNETLILLICLPFYIVTAIFHPTLLGRVFCWAFTILMLPFFYFLWLKYQEMQRFYTAHQDLKTALSQTVRTLGKGLRLSFLINTALMPFVLPLGGYVGFTWSLPPESMTRLWNKFSLGAVHPGVWVLLALVVFGGSFLLGIPYVKWWIKCFYGKHLEKLKACLSELEELEYKKI